jgi:carnitine 3-dehydrogenase
MGTFLIYRIAGGEAGMRHFMAQFGPALKWPWTKLTDVPELDDALLDKLVAQSDAQAGGLGIRELERIRDDNLVAILQALRTQRDGRGWGAGALLRDFEARLLARAHGPAGARPADLTRPLRLLETAVRPDWVDYNNHMTESRYLQVFGDATDALLGFVGFDDAYRAGAGSFYTVETHIVHRREIAGLEPLYATTQLLGADAKRIHVFHRLHHARDDALLASAEQLLVHVDARTRKAAPAVAPLATRLAEIAAAHAALPRPDEAGRAVAMRR